MPLINPLMMSRTVNGASIYVALIIAWMMSRAVNGTGTCVVTCCDRFMHFCLFGFLHYNGIVVFSSIYKLPSIVYKIDT